MENEAAEHHERQEVTPLFSEVEGLKGHVSLQREEMETQTHPGHLSTDLAQARKPLQSLKARLPFLPFTGTLLFLPHPWLQEVVTNKPLP